MGKKFSALLGDRLKLKNFVNNITHCVNVINVGPFDFIFATKYFS
jgi:hypothetical protein